MESTTEIPRLYVVVRGNMTRSQQAIQCGHAVAKFVKQFPDVWPNRTLIYLRTPSEEDLLKLHNDLLQLSKHVVLYQDPSWNNSTSLAVLSTPEVKPLLQKLSLI